MRIVLVTDSLGCPRKEISVDKTWTYRIMHHYSGSGFVFYTFCHHALDNHGLSGFISEIRQLEPDIIVMQVGIVDASRRVMDKDTKERVIRYPFPIRKIIQLLCHYLHKTLTKHKEIHYSTALQLRNTIESILGGGTGCRMIYVAIAPAGKKMTEKIYNIENDIKTYNDEIKKIDSKYFHFVDPYVHLSEKDFLLPDGHHLNYLGEDIVYQSVLRALLKILGLK